MQVTLSIADRLVLLQLLPQAESLLTMRVSRDLGQKLALTMDELERWNVVERGNRVEWDVELADTELAMEMQAREVELVASQLRQLDEAKAVEGHHLPLFDKFGVE